MGARRLVESTTMSNRKLTSNRSLMTASGLLKIFRFRVNVEPAILVFLSARGRDVLKIFESDMVSEHVRQPRISIYVQFLRVFTHFWFHALMILFGIFPMC